LVVAKGWAAVARFGGIGDNLIAACVLKPLKQLGYNVEVLSSPPMHCVFLHNPHIDKLSIKHDGDMPKDDPKGWQNWHRSRAAEYDVYVHLSHSVEGHLALFEHQTEFWWRPEYRRMTCGANYLETAMDIAGVPHLFGPLYYASGEEKAGAQETKRKVGEKAIGWILSGTRIDKTWPYSTMAICRIIKELGVPVIMIGAGGKQFSMAETIQKDVQRTNSTDDGLHLALTPDGSEEAGDYGKVWSVRRSLALAQACDLIVSPDTGFAWATAFEPMPKVILLSHASPENITKHWVNTVTMTADPDEVPCFPCHRLHDRPETCTVSKDGNSAACMAGISVENVVSTIAGLL
jgi:ADP-heptose:LPS heptosyltransferase